MFKKISKALVPTLSSLLIAFLALEGILRFSGFGYTRPTSIYNNEIIKGKANAHFWMFDENENEVFFNNFGFHDKEWITNSARKQVLMLGDSLVAGLEVPVQSLFSTLLEKKIPNLDILNAGVSGASTAHEYALWHRYLKHHVHPKHIVLSVFLGNDLEENSEDLALQRAYTYVLKADGEVYLNHREMTWQEKMIYYSGNWSAAIYTVYRHSTILRSNWGRIGQNGAPTMEGSSESKPLEQSIMGTLNLLAKWKAELSKEGIGFSIFLIHSPNYYERKSYGDARATALHLQFVDKLKELCSAQDIDFLELDFSQKDPYDLYSFHRKMLGHFNYEGHRLTAETLYPWLEKTLSSAL